DRGYRQTRAGPDPVATPAAAGWESCAAARSLRARRAIARFPPRTASGRRRARSRDAVDAPPPAAAPDPAEDARIATPQESCAGSRRFRAHGTTAPDWPWARDTDAGPSPAAPDSRDSSRRTARRPGGPR